MTVDLHALAAKLGECVQYVDDHVLLIHGRWQDVIGELPQVDAVITDPPYSDRTHKGQRTGSEIRMPTIGYDSLDEAAARSLATAAAQLSKGWAVFFCDHLAFRWFEAEWEEQGRYAFAPVFMKTNPPPRFSGDGPALALEFMSVSRPRERWNCGSLPGYYTAQVGGDRSTRTVPGTKPLPLMLSVVGDYSSEGDLILDLCAGAGTTGRAAKDLGRQAILIEMDAETCAKAAKVLRPRRAWQQEMF